MGLRILAVAYSEFTASILFGYRKLDVIEEPKSGLTISRELEYLAKHELKPGTRGRMSGGC